MCYKCTRARYGVCKRRKGAIEAFKINQSKYTILGGFCKFPTDSSSTTLITMFVCLQVSRHVEAQEP